MGRTKHGTFETTADRIRAALKAAGYKAKAVTVREPHYGDITVTIRDASIQLGPVKELASSFRNVRHDEATGEILSGGNTFVDVEYHADVLAPVAAAIEARLQAAPANIAIRVGDVEVFWGPDGASGNNLVAKLSSSPGSFVQTYAGWGATLEFKHASKQLAEDLLARGVPLDAPVPPAEEDVPFAASEAPIEHELAPCVMAADSVPEGDDHPPGPVLAPSDCRPLAPFPDKDRFREEIPFELAQAAHAGSSFVPEQRAQQERDGYAAQLASDFEELARYATTEEKRATLETEFARYKVGYRRRYLAYLSARSRVMSPMITGPSKFPTARNRKRLDAEHARFEELEGFRGKALEQIRKALRPELRPVMAGDDDAIDRLRAKIANAEALQALMTNANKVIRANMGNPFAQVAALVTLGFHTGKANDLLKPDYMGRLGFASYELTNNGANLRRMKARLEEISRAKVAEVTEQIGEHARLEDNPADNRVRLYFAGKPEAPVRARLKGAGFRWTPSLGCWQAYRNHRSIDVARREAAIPEAS